MAFATILITSIRSRTRGEDGIRSGHGGCQTRRRNYVLVRGKQASAADLSFVLYVTVADTGGGGPTLLEKKGLPVGWIKEEKSEKRHPRRGQQEGLTRVHWHRRGYQRNLGSATSGQSLSSKKIKKIKGGERKKGDQHPTKGGLSDML